jgi:hypothetical protein
MAVYVDNLRPSLKNKNWRYDKACHLMSDSIDELHLFASKIGLKRSWFQSNTLPHYDLTRRMRARAIDFGAVEITDKQMVEMIHKHRHRKAATDGKDFISR